MRVGTIMAAGVLAVFLCSAASASEFRILHSFCASSGCPDGHFPVAALSVDGQGNLYGTTSLGGADDAGVVFEIERTGDKPVYRRLFSFDNCADCTSGFNPQTPVMLAANGAVYGTAYFGGTHGAGTLFKLTPAAGHWRAHVFHDFCSSSYCSDGSNPLSGMFYAQSRYGIGYDGKSWAYGTTVGGGPNGYGALYRWAPKRGEFIAKSFCQAQGCTDGAQPNGEVAFDDAGYPCGTTRAGGTANQGTLYCLDDDSDDAWSYAFCSLSNCADGADPQAGVVPDGDNNVLGTTRFGGQYGQGTVYAISSGTLPHEEHVVYSFCRLANCADGKNPVSAVLLVGGTLYGTTLGGGQYGGGTIYRIDPTGHETVLHAFCRASGCSDGYQPQAALSTDGNGHLFGTTTAGGRHGAGTAFELDL